MDATLANRKITQEKWLHGGGLLRRHWCLKKIDVIAGMPWVLPQKGPAPPCHTCQALRVTLPGGLVLKNKSMGQTKKTALDYKKWMQPSTLASRKITQEKWLHGGGLLRWHWCLKKIDVIASMPWVLPQKVLALPDEDKA
jgi:hypothetical protein